VIGVLEHVSEEADVLRTGLAKHDPESLQEIGGNGISTGVKKIDDQRTEFGNGLRARLLRRRALRLGPGRVRLPAPLVQRPSAL
jgi:hypothetical protein